MNNKIKVTILFLCLALNFHAKADSDWEVIFYPSFLTPGINTALTITGMMAIGATNKEQMAAQLLDDIETHRSVGMTSQLLTETIRINKVERDEEDDFLDALYLELVSL